MELAVRIAGFKFHFLAELMKLKLKLQGDHSAKVVIMNI